MCYKAGMKKFKEVSLDVIKSIYYEILSYFVPRRQKYIIGGYCCKCGNCCHEIRALGMKNEFDLKIMQFIFPWYRFFYISKYDEKGNVILSCSKQKENGECSIYNIRPLLCRNYPRKNIYFYADMPEGCSYYIERKSFKDMI